MVQDHFLQAAARITVMVRVRQSACTGRGAGGSGPSSALRPGAVIGAPYRPKMPSPEVSLPGPFVTPPSPVLPVATTLAAYLRGSCGVRARVLYGCGPAQVGFGVSFILLSSPHPFF